MKKLYFLLIAIIAISISVTAQKKILYVGFSAEEEMLPSDSITIVYLEEALFDITYVEDDDVASTYDYSPYDAVVFGESCSSSKVIAFGMTNKFPAPCVMLEPLAPRDDKWGWIANREDHWQENREALTGWDKLQILDTTHYITNVFSEDEVVPWSTATVEVTGYELYAHGFDLNTYIPDAIPLGQNMSSAITFPCLWAFEKETKVSASDTLHHRMVLWGIHAYAIANDKDDNPDFRSVYAGDAYKTIVLRSLDWVLGTDVGISDIESPAFNVRIYPNPVSDYAKLKFTLEKPEMVSLRIINMVGQTIETIEKQYMNRGSNEIRINTGDLHSGLYLYIFEAGSNKYNGKIHVLK